MILQTLQILQILLRHVQDHGRLTAVHISKHSLFRLKITVSCPPCTYPSIHVETLKITVGCRLCAYPSIRVCVWCVCNVSVLWWCCVVMWYWCWCAMCGVCCVVCVVCGAAWQAETLPCAGSKRLRAHAFQYARVLPVHTETF